MTKQYLGSSCGELEQVKMRPWKTIFESTVFTLEPFEYKATNKWDRERWYVCLCDGLATFAVGNITCAGYKWGKIANRVATMLWRFSICDSSTASNSNNMSAIAEIKLDKWAIVSSNWSCWLQKVVQELNQRGYLAEWNRSLKWNNFTRTRFSSHGPTNCWIGAAKWPNPRIAIHISKILLDCDSNRS
jgi:hypothetical protein